MKTYLKINFVVVLVIVAMSGCKENGAILPWGNTSVLSDTTYVESNIQVAETKNVLVEMYTGVSCPNCPQAHAALDQLLSTFTGRIVGVAMHVAFDANGYDRPVSGTPNVVLEAPDAQTLLTNFGEPGARPSGAIDRLVHNDYGATSIYAADYRNWIQYTRAQIALPTPVNLTVTRVYDSITKTLTIAAEMHYTAAQSDTQKLSVLLTEDSIISGQENGSLIDTFYIHNDILRKYVTNPVGDRMNVAIKAGTVIRRMYSYQITNALWRPEHMHIVAFVHKNGTASAQVLQVKSISVR